MKKNYPSKSIVPVLIKSPVDSIIWGILSILVGVVFILSPLYNTPVSREEAVSYEGYFASYDYKAGTNKINGMYFSDGTRLNIHAYKQFNESKEQMEALPKGTKIYALVNPNNNHVVELRTEKLELLNFERSLQEVARHNNFYIGIGVFVVVGGLSMMAHGFGSHFYKNRKKKKFK